MKLYSIRENHLFSKAYAKGKKYVGRQVVVYLLPDYAASRLAKANPTHERLNRVGITVTKKLGCAVVRNRAKRIIRAGFRSAEQRTPIKRGFLIVIVARQSIVGVSSTALERDFTAAFGKLGLVK